MLQIKSATSNFELDFNGTGKEEEAFLDAVSLAISIKKDNKTTEATIEQDKPVENQTVKEQEIIKVATEQVKEVITEAVTEKIIKKTCEPNPYTEDTTKQMDTPKYHKKPYQEVSTTNRRLVIGLCDECEDQYGIFIYDNVQGTYRVECRKCGHTNHVIIDDLVPARMVCECGKVNNFYMEASQYATIECNNCKSDVDMIYHDKHKKMVSANLL